MENNINYISIQFANRTVDFWRCGGCHTSQIWRENTEKEGALYLLESEHNVRVCRYFGIEGDFHNFAVLCEIVALNPLQELIQSSQDIELSHSVPLLIPTDPTRTIDPLLLDEWNTRYKLQDEEA